MNIIIFGATGTVGTHLVEQALEQGHNVTAFVRTPAKVTQTHPSLSIVQGDVLDPASVLRAMPQHDAVLGALGAGRDGSLRSTGTRHIVQAMQKTGVQRLICQTSLGVGDSAGNLNFFWKYIMFGILLRAAFADHGRQEAIIQQSGLDWTIVRPAAFTDDSLSKTYRHGFDGNAKGLTLKIGRSDVAHFMLEQLKTDTYLQKTPGLSYQVKSAEQVAVLRRA